MEDADLTPSHKLALQDFNRLLRIVETAPVMLAEVDKDLVYTFINSSYAKLFGKRRQDVIGQPVASVLGEQGFAEAKYYIDKVLGGETVHYDLDLSTVTHTPKIVKVSYSPEYNHRGEVTGFIAAIIDKTEEVLARNRADKLNDTLEAAHHLSLIGLLVTRAVRDDNGKVVDFEFIYSNPKAEEIALVEPGGFEGNKLLDLFPGNVETGLFSAYSDVVTNGTAFVEEMHYNHDGLNFWVEISAIKLGDGCAISFRDVSERKRSDEHKVLLMNELNHRVKNTLATVQSMASQTALSVDDLDSFAEKFIPRLRSIANAHDILLKSKSGQVRLETIIDGQLRPYIAMNSQRLKLKGKDIILEGSTADALSLVLHELTTNACKYGALSNDTGYISVAWKKVRGFIKINWQENDGPEVEPPKHKGFGSTLIEQSLKYSLKAEVSLSYKPSGLEVEIYLPTDNPHSV